MSSYTHEMSVTFLCDGCGETVDAATDDMPEGWLPILVGADACDACGPYCAWQILGIFRDDLAQEVRRENPEWDEYEDGYQPPRPMVDVAVQESLL